MTGSSPSAAMSDDDTSSIASFSSAPDLTQLESTTSSDSFSCQDPCRSLPNSDPPSLNDGATANMALSPPPAAAKAEVQSQPDTQPREYAWSPKAAKKVSTSKQIKSLEKRRKQLLSSEVRTAEEEIEFEALTAERDRMFQAQ